MSNAGLVGSKRSAPPRGPLVAFLLAIPLAMACSGLGGEIATGVDATRRAVHQRCHSDYNACRLAAGTHQRHKQACEDELAACVSVPSTE